MQLDIGREQNLGQESCISGSKIQAQGPAIPKYEKQCILAHPACDTGGLKSKDFAITTSLHL